MRAHTNTHAHTLTHSHMLMLLSDSSIGIIHCTSMAYSTYASKQTQISMQYQKFNVYTIHAEMQAYTHTHTKEIFIATPKPISNSCQLFKKNVLMNATRCVLITIWLHCECTYLCVCVCFRCIIGTSIVCTILLLI